MVLDWIERGRLRRVNFLVLIVEAGGWGLETASGALCDVGVVVRGAVVTI